MTFPPHIKETIEAGQDGVMLTTAYRDNKLVLKKIGTYGQVRHMYNQAACLLGALAMVKITRSRGKSPEWNLPSANHTLRDLPEIFELICRDEPCTLADTIGSAIRYHQWPQDAASLPGMRNAFKALMALGTVLHSYQCLPSITVGGAAWLSLKKRVLDAIAVAHYYGFCPFKENELIEFLEHLYEAKTIQFCHLTEL